MEIRMDTNEALSIAINALLTIANDLPSEDAKKIKNQRDYYIALAKSAIATIYSTSSKD